MTQPQNFPQPLPYPEDKPAIPDCLQALEEAVSTSENSSLADGDYRILQKVRALQRAADLTRNGHLSYEDLMGSIIRLSDVQEKLEERSTKYGRTRGQPAPEKEGSLERVSDKLKILLLRTPRPDEGESVADDTEMGG